MNAQSWFLDQRKRQKNPGKSTVLGAEPPYSEDGTVRYKPCVVRLEITHASSPRFAEAGEEDWLLAQAIDPNRLPAHVAIIMDGNGRWANRRNMPRVAGHQAGIDPVRNTVETCARLGIRALTLYAFSVENWKRPRHEVETLWRLLRFYLKREIAEVDGEQYPALRDWPAACAALLRFKMSCWPASMPLAAIPGFG